MNTTHRRTGAPTHPVVRSAITLAIALLLCAGAPVRRCAAQDVGMTLGTVPATAVVQDTAGASVDLAQRYVGKKPVLFEFWASWCEICQALLPRMEAAQRRFGVRWQLLAAQMLARLVFLALEVTLLLGFAVLVLDVPMRGAVGSVALVCLLGALSFVGLGLLVAGVLRDAQFVEVGLRSPEPFDEFVVMRSNVHLSGGAEMADTHPGIATQPGPDGTWETRKALVFFNDFPPAELYGREVELALTAPTTRCRLHASMHGRLVEGGVQLQDAGLP